MRRTWHATYTAIRTHRCRREPMRGATLAVLTVIGKACSSRASLHREEARGGSFRLPCAGLQQAERRLAVSLLPSFSQEGANSTKCQPPGAGTSVVPRASARAQRVSPPLRTSSTSTLASEVTGQVRRAMLENIWTEFDEAFETQRDVNEPHIQQPHTRASDV